MVGLGLSLLVGIYIPTSSSRCLSQRHFQICYKAYAWPLISSCWFLSAARWGRRCVQGEEMERKGNGKMRLCGDSILFHRTHISLSYGFMGRRFRGSYVVSCVFFLLQARARCEIALRSLLNVHFHFHFSQAFVRRRIFFQSPQQPYSCLFNNTNLPLPCQRTGLYHANLINIAILTY
jgi:hypothetical protein